MRMRSSNAARNAQANPEGSAVRRGNRVYVPRPPRVPRFGTVLPDLFDADTESDVGVPPASSTAPKADTVPVPAQVGAISVSPAACDFFEAGARPPEPIEALAPEVVVPPRTEALRKRRAKVVITAVCALGAAVFVLAGLRMAQRAPTSDPPVPVEQTQAAAVPTAPVPAAGTPAPQSPAAGSKPTDATRAKATPAPKGAARPVRPQRPYTPQSI
jgi:hypothetical protein